MPRVNLIGGAYTAQSIIANAQRALNLYPEKNQEDAPVPFSHYPSPGLVKLGVPPQVATVRCVYWANNNQLFTCIGDGIYYVDQSWTFSLAGNIAPGVTPVKMMDNLTDLFIVDGTSSGYTINLATHAFTPVVDAAFYGSNFVEFLDTFFLFNKPDTQIFYSSDSNAITFDALFFASKTAYADKLAGIAVQQRQLWLIGQKTTEIWFNAGGTDFPFQIIQGPFVEHGTIAQYSIAKQGGTVMWLSQDQSGTSIVVQSDNYKAKKISTSAIEYAISTYSTVSDAIGFCYEQRGHTFYWLKFPTAGRDWLYDLTTDLWHERAWLNPATGQEEGHRVNCAVFAYGVNVAGDRANGQLYQMDPAVYTDAGDPILRVRGYPHMVSNGDRVFYTQFIADIECGEATISDGDPQVYLRWSDNRGATYGNKVAQTLGTAGDFLAQPSWNRLGMARDRVFEVSWTAPVRTALNGAFVDFQLSES